MTLILAFAAGLLTLINPCILPVLPIVLASALHQHQLGPLALALGMITSFTVLGFTLAAFGLSIGLTDETLSTASALLMTGFGLILLVPRWSASFATATAGLSMRADRSIDTLEGSGLPGQFLGGALLGGVWSPCVGPTLGGAISLASQGRDLGMVALTMASFAAGVAAVILGFAYATRALLSRSRGTLHRIAALARPVMGAVFAVTGLALLFHLNRPVEIWLIEHLPIWLQDFSVSI